jgi:GNAT superfamily N-acetyltransferase
MRIEIAEVTDESTVVALLAEQFREHRIELGQKLLSDAVSSLIADPTRGFVLLARDPEPGSGRNETVGRKAGGSGRNETVGVAVLAYTWTLEHGGKVAWLDELFVVPEHRGRGLGRALLLRALELARDAGCRAVDLEVDADHARAERLYQREGFRALARRRWTRPLA